VAPSTPEQLPATDHGFSENPCTVAATSIASLNVTVTLVDVLIPEVALSGTTRVTVGGVLSVPADVVQVALELATRLPASLADSTAVYVVLASSGLVSVSRLPSGYGLVHVPPYWAHRGTCPLPLYT